MDFRKKIDDALQSSNFSESLLGEIPRATTPLSGGNFSAVYQVELADGTVQVLKFSDDLTWLRKEKLFLERWSQQGVRTPEIYLCAPLPTGWQGGFLQMEMVMGQNLFPLMECDGVESEKVLRDLGTILATMHQATAHGYGEMTIGEDGQIVGQETIFSQTLSSADWLDTITVNQRNGDLLDGEMLLIDNAGKLLDDQRGGLGGCFAHTDFRAGNILYDKTHDQPYTVIDPNPDLTHPYLCLAYSLLLEEIHGRNDPLHFRQGYEAMSPVDDSALHAAFFLKALELLPRWGEPGAMYADDLHQFFRREKKWLLQHR